LDQRSAEDVDDAGEDVPIKLPFKIFLITDRKLAASHGGLIAMTTAALSAAPPGTVAVQLREKDLDAAELLALARELRTICDRYHARLIVNDRIDVAIAAHADGVHLPADSFSVADARALIGNATGLATELDSSAPLSDHGPTVVSTGVADARSVLISAGLVGVSTHNESEVVSAAQAGADFVVFGPVFDPLSKPSYTSARGLAGLIAASRAVSIPVFALGGVTASRIRDLGIAIAEAKARGQAIHIAGIAVIGSIFEAPDPGAAMRDLVTALASW